MWGAAFHHRGVLWGGCLLVALWLPLATSFAQDAAPSDADLPLGALAYTADLANWQPGSYSDGTFAWQPSPDGLVLDNPDPESPARFAFGTAHLAENFYMEMVYTPAVCAAPQSALLLNVRSDPLAESPTVASAYVFVLQCDGVYRSRQVTDGTSGFIDQDGSLGYPLSAGKPVNLGILMQGRAVRWFINGEEIASYLTAAQPAPGQFAIGAQLGLSGTLNSLRVWSLVGETPVSPQTLTAERLGDALFTSNFDDLLTGMAGDDLRGLRIGGVMVTSTQQARLSRVITPTPDGAFYAEVVFGMRQCAAAGGFGLTVGEVSAALFCDGTLRLQSADGELLLETTAPTEVTPFGAALTLGIALEDDMLSVYVSRALVGSIDGVSGGALGAVWFAPDATRTEVSLERLTIYPLP